MLQKVRAKINDFLSYQLSAFSFSFLVLLDFGVKMFYLDDVNSDPQNFLILSASRTKDMVHRCPDLLAAILLGEAPCRWGPHGPLGRVDPGHLHSVVLWMKSPANLLTHVGLREALFHLRSKLGVLISLELTATGLGSSFIEPGIPSWHSVLADMRKLLAEGWIDPRAVVYRYDPFLSVRTAKGHIISNADNAMFEKVCAGFLDLGIKRVTTSRADAVHYPRVAQRIQSLDLEWIQIDDAAATELCGQMAEFCHSRDADFSICCDPVLSDLTDNWGCIDGRWLNRIKGEGYPPATEILHNKIGQQRPTCQCTYSRDVGYSPGSQTCYSGGFGCLYCYSQGNALPPEPMRFRREIAQFDKNSEEYLHQLGF